MAVLKMTYPQYKELSERSVRHLLTAYNIRISRTTETNGNGMETPSVSKKSRK